MIPGSMPSRYPLHRNTGRGGRTQIEEVISRVRTARVCAMRGEAHTAVGPACGMGSRKRKTASGSTYPDKRALNPTSSRDSTS